LLLIEVTFHSFCRNESYRP